MRIFNTVSPGRQAAVNSLAAVGFVALVAGGMWLAVYSARYVPTAIGNLGTAAVSLSSIFASRGAPAGLSVVPAATTTLPFSSASSTMVSTAEPAPVKTASPAPSPTPATGKETTRTIQVGGATTPALYGLPDFTVTIDATGYLATTSATSFVATSTVPAGSRPAVKFTIKNIGTNATGPWRFSASIPTQTAYIYQSLPQQSLNPGDSIEYTLGFTEANSGANQTVSITANFDHAVAESNANNDSASAQLTILGR
ncbi:MAG TPA: CARDB domain-containing protein [Candidatus Paceibacterota bacterium]|nr:CARDB domain-containing protein [Candidatus Paceibacterota bacterium]